MNKLVYVVLSALILVACQKKLDLPHVDEERWKADPNGCELVRITMEDGMITDKDMIKGLNQDEIVELLGLPDQNELYKRNQKFFIYNITPTDCNPEIDTSVSKYLSIRFNATGLAKEVVIYTR